VNPASVGLLLLLIMVAMIFWMAGLRWGALGVAAGPAAASRAVAERAAVDLRQGMTIDEVRELLGKPWRTALTGDSGAGTLRWTYNWVGPPSSSSSERMLNVDFTAKKVEQWSVSGWNWSSY
jgi:hypothetical protein